MAVTAASARNAAEGIIAAMPRRSADFFCYGSLEFEAVMRAVTGRSYPREPASLEGWERRRVRRANFPGVRARAGAVTRGTLFRGVGAAESERLDRFETDLYDRRLLPVRTCSGALVDAWVYVVPEERARALSEEPWNPARLARELDGFLALIQRGRFRPNRT
jgi:gamma-glutamylcyclotransferase (GGCT)/AIG2-like uncharacterized protein YtfP